LPGSGVGKHSEAGVRKASKEETAGEFALAVVSGYGDLAKTGVSRATNRGRPAGYSP
jgi:hypothetical protein